MLFSKACDYFKKKNSEEVFMVDLVAGLAGGLAAGLFGGILGYILGGLAAGILGGILGGLWGGLMVCLAGNLLGGLVVCLAGGLVAGIAQYPFFIFPTNIIIFAVILFFGEALFLFDKRKPKEDVGKYWHTLCLNGEAWFESVLICFNTYNFLVFDWSVFGVWCESNNALIQKIICFFGAGSLIVFLFVGILFLNAQRYNKHYRKEKKQKKEDEGN